MSTTAVGVTLDLEGPLPVARRHSLLATEGVVKNDENDRWMSGVRVVGYPDGVPSRWEPCTTGTTRVKDDSVGDGYPGSRFEPIAVYFPVSCSTHGMSNSAVENLVTRTEQVLDATLSFGVEQSLVSGTPFSVNPFIGDGNMTALASSAAVSPRIGLSYLENAIGELTARQGLIHAVPAVTVAWGYGAGLYDTAEIYTPNGTPVASGDGYIGARPSGKPGLTATQAWTFATGPVEVRIQDEVRSTIDESVDRQSNDIVIRAERWVLPEWDQALQVGVLIDWSLAP